MKNDKARTFTRTEHFLFCFVSFLCFSEPDQSNMWSWSPAQAISIHDPRVVSSPFSKTGSASFAQPSSHTHTLTVSDYKEQMRQKLREKFPGFEDFALARSHICPFPACSKGFKTSGHLNVHVRGVHLGEKLFPCSSCSKRFSSQQKRDIHVRFHTDERPFACSFDNCQKSFQTKHQLQAHQNVHTGEKPFKCPFLNCEKAFSDPSALRKHKRTQKHQIQQQQA